MEMQQPTQPDQLQQQDFIAPLGLHETLITPFEEGLALVRRTDIYISVSVLEGGAEVETRQPAKKKLRYSPERELH